jgi:soluble lytic murein transglycosylase-like protein
MKTAPSYGWLWKWRVVLQCPSHYGSAISVKAVRAAVCTLIGLTSLALLPATAASPASLASPRLHPFQRSELLAPQPVHIAQGADGRKVIFSETSVQHARRFAADLLPVPDLPGLPSGGLEPIIRRHCEARHLDQRLVRAVIQVESGYNHRARSNKGAMGLMQLMPGTAVELAVFHPYDVDENLRGGTAYLRQLIDAFPGSLEMAIAAYNAGPGAVERHHGVPPYPDTVDYVKRVMALYRGDGLPGSASWQWHSGRRPAPFVTRGASGRLLLTTSLPGSR